MMLRWGDGSGHEEEILESGWMQWIMVVLSSSLLLGCRAVEGGRSSGGNQHRWNFNGADYGRWKWGRGDNGMQPFLEGERGRRRGGSMVPEADDTMKSGAVVGEAKGGGWYLGVEDDQRKFGR
jgi:hypothetical protein